MGMQQKIQQLRLAMAQRHLVALFLTSLQACAINPVPTPGTGSNGLVAADDALLSKDSAADTFKNADDAGGTGAVPAVALATVEATMTDAAITGGTHLAAVATEVAATGKLVVILADEQQSPENYTNLAKAAAQLGHRVLVLDWSPQPSIRMACAGEYVCLEMARQEALDGQNRTSSVDVNLANSLQGRLVKAVTWLDKHFPGQNWGQDYNGSTPVWSHIAIAGHGDGASEAAMVGMKLSVWRVVLLGGPLDGIGNDAVGASTADWLHGVPTTAKSNWRGFAHTKDQFSAIIAAAWTALGLGSSAAAVSVDGPTTPGISTQLLTTSANVPEPYGTIAHAAIARDDALPTDALAAQHVRAAWKILFWPF